MTYDARRHDRRSIRLKGYDYAQAGAYFVTIVTQDRACLFGDVVDGEMRLNAAGRMVVAEWQMMPARFPNVALDAFVVMPNHLHGILVITHDPPARPGLVPAPDPVGAGLVPAPDPAITPVGAGPVPAPDPAITPIGATTRVAPTGPTVGHVVGAFKSRVTVEYARGVEMFGWPRFRGRVWQRNYYEHIIRDEESWNRIRQYIVDNPARWMHDAENPLVAASEAENAWAR